MSAAKAKGTRWESSVVAFLRERGFVHAERRALNGTKDRGDITGIPGVVIECKSQNRQSLAEWLDEAEEERANDGANTSSVWFKRRGFTSPAKAYVLLTGDRYVELLRDAGYGGGR